MQITAKTTYMGAGVPVFWRNQSIAIGNSCAVRKEEPNRKTHTMASAALRTLLGKISETMIQLSGASPNVKVPAPSIIGRITEAAGAWNARSADINRWLPAMPSVLAMRSPRRL